MKKALKIAGISLASLVGLVLVVAAVALAILNSPKRLTNMVKKYAPKVVDCGMEFGEAKLNLFKDFPNIGVDIHNAALLNPMEGSPTDTLANIDCLTLIADIEKLLCDKAIIINECFIEDALINLYTDSTGRRNFDVFKKTEGKTESNFDYLIDIEEVKLKNTTLFYTDDRNGMAAQANKLDLNLEGGMQNDSIDAVLDLNAAALSLRVKDIDLAIKDLKLNFDGDLKQKEVLDCLFEMHTPDICLAIKENYLEHDTLDLNGYLNLDLAQKKACFDDWEIDLNQFDITVRGQAQMAENKDIGLDVNLSTNTLTIEDVLTYLPEKLQKKLSSIEYAGKVRIKDAVMVGTYNDSLKPRILAQVLTENATVNVPKLPYPFTNVNLDADLDLNPNSDINTLTINSLNAKFNRSSLTVDGLVDNLLGDIGLKLKVKGDMPMSDIKRFLPKNMRLAGQSRLDLNTDFNLKDLTKALKDYDFSRLNARAAVNVKDFSFEMDTIQASAPQLAINLALPALTKKGDVRIDLASDLLEAQVGKLIQGDLNQPNIKMNVAHFDKRFENMVWTAELQCHQIALVYDTITAQIDSPSFELASSSAKTSKGMNPKIDFGSGSIEAALGKSNTFKASSVIIDATTRQNKSKSGFFDRWNPSVEFALNDAFVNLGAISEDIHINTIDFSLDTLQLNLKKSTLSIGRSDVSLEGNITGFKEWIEDHHNLMWGELSLSSNLLDINEIMDITNGLGRSDAEKAEAEADGDNPFLVPEGVDFDFTVSTKKSLYNNFDLNNLSGSLTVKDGTLILQEIGFTNKAAKMQLTAMYQSPRPNHLFLAMDFHLLDVQIRDLLDMIPFIDTLVPMLKTFDGQGEFHIGAETNLKSNYQPKISTLRAAADIEGKNLTVNNKFAFTNITDKLQVSTDGEYRVDSLDVQLTAFKDEIDLWPSQIAIGKYKITVDGRMTLDKNGEYHLSVTETPVFLPNRMGLKLSGPINDLDYVLEKPKFPTLYKPNKRNDREQLYYEMKQRIADRLKENVRTRP